MKLSPHFLPIFVLFSLLLTQSLWATFHAPGTVAIDYLNISPEDEKAFQKVLTDLSRIYKFEFLKKGRRLRVIDENVYGLAEARKDFFRKSVVALNFEEWNHISGNVDGLALVVCHEIGHHIGGKPYFDKEIAEEFNVKNMSIEGQADYFATSKCLKRLWGKEPVVLLQRRPNVLEETWGLCEKQLKNPKDIYICQRTLNAVAELLKTDYFEDQKIVDYKKLTPTEEFYSWHPEDDCRINTFISGALCPAGKTCEQGPGARPLCWYKPN